MDSDTRWSLKFAIDRFIDDVSDVVDLDVTEYPPSAQGTDGTLWTDGELRQYLADVSAQILLRLERETLLASERLARAMLSKAEKKVERMRQALNAVADGVCGHCGSTNNHLEFEGCLVYRALKLSE